MAYLPFTGILLVIHGLLYYNSTVILNEAGLLHLRDFIIAPVFGGGMHAMHYANYSK